MKFKLRRKSIDGRRRAMIVVARAKIDGAVFRRGRSGEVAKSGEFPAFLFRRCRRRSILRLRGKIDQEIVVIDKTRSAEEIPRFVCV